MSMGGGGSQSATTTSGIDPEFKPYLKRVLSDVTDRYDEERSMGADALVAGLSDEQKAAHELQRGLAHEAQAGYDDLIARDLQNTAGQMMTGQQGSLGSARAARAREAALADRALDLRQASDQRKLAGAQQLGQVGAELQEMQQRRLDAPHTSAQRYFGYLGSAPQQSTQSQGGGGK